MINGKESRTDNHDYYCYCYESTFLSGIHINDQYREGQELGQGFGMSMGRNRDTPRIMGRGLMNKWKTDVKKVKLFLCLSDLLGPLCDHNPAIPIV